MIHYALIDEEGCVTEAGTTDRPPLGYIPFKDGLEPQWAEWLMFKDGGWQERPLPPAPVVTNGRFLLEECPVGTRALVMDAQTGAFFGEALEENGVLDIELPDPGGYMIEVEPPRPWIKPEIMTILVEL